MRLGILLFDNVELLDFAGPYEVFTRAASISSPPAWEVVSVAQSKKPVLSHNGLSINPKYSLGDCPELEILLIPGGIGTRALLNESETAQEFIDWIVTRASSARLVLSVCTGALVLAKAGLLDGLSATTYHTAFDLLENLSPTTTVVRDQRFVDNGRVITSAGIAAGIDMSLHVVGKLLGEEKAAETARQIEYSPT